MLPNETMPVSLTIDHFAHLIGRIGTAEANDAGLSGHDTLLPEGHYIRRVPAFLNITRSDSATASQILEQRNLAFQHYGYIQRGFFHDAQVTGTGTLVTRNGKVIAESCVEYLAQSQTPPGLVDLTGGNFALAHHPSRRITDPCILIKRPSWPNYGHWLVEGAAMIALLAGNIEHTRANLVVGAYSGRYAAMDKIIHDTIKIICPSAKVIEHPDNETWSFDRIDYVTPIHGPPSTKVPLPLEKLRSLILQAAGPQKQRNRRIYLSRRDQATRRVENEDEIMTVLSSYGFEDVSCIGMSITEQALLFSECEAIIGVKGAALSNILFCRPGCNIMVLSPSNWSDPFFYDIANQVGLQYGELFCDVTDGPVAGHHDFVVSPTDLKEMINAMT